MLLLRRRNGRRLSRKILMKMLQWPFLMNLSVRARPRARRESKLQLVREERDGERELMLHVS